MVGRLRAARGTVPAPDARRTKRMKRAMLLVALAMAACGGSDPVDGDPTTPDANVERPDSQPSGPSTCSSTEECSGGTLCDPTSHACVASVSCAKNEDCGTAAYCGAGGACAAASTGS